MLRLQDQQDRDRARRGDPPRRPRHARSSTASSPTSSKSWSSCPGKPARRAGGTTTARSSPARSSALRPRRRRCGPTRRCWCPACCRPPTTPVRSPGPPARTSRPPNSTAGWPAARPASSCCSTRSRRSTGRSIDEAVLCRPVGGPKAMAAQLAQLIELGSLPHVTLQVIPVRIRRARRNGRRRS